MIFVTVGTQLPFPRLIQTLDELAGRLDLDIFAQTADPLASPQNLCSAPYLEPSAYEQKVSACSVIVGHAGIGTVLQAKRARKPVILFPRRADAGEHRNDHQLATARFLAGVTGVSIAWDEADLEALLVAAPGPPATAEPGPAASKLIRALAAQLTQWAEVGK